MNEVLELSEMRLLCKELEKGFIQGRKISAIHLLRALTNFSLRECKDIIDAKTSQYQTEAYANLIDHAKELEKDLKACQPSGEVREMLIKIYSFLN